jgi:hypothetical protein
MKHLSIFKTHVHEIKIDKITDKINLWLFGDVHRDTSACDVDRWRWFLKQSKECENPYYLGMGDYHDFASYKEGQKMQSIGLHDQTIEAINELVKKRNRAFAMEIKQMRNRLIGLIGGNHTWLEDGITSDEDLANRMGCEYLGWVTLVSLRISFANSSSKKMVNIFACHGLGGGRVLGSQVRKVEDLFQVIPSADIYAMGHDHSRGAWPQPRLYPVYGRDGVRIKQQRQFFCRTGSFMKSYEEGNSGYAVSKLMKPADLGALRLDISFHRDRTNYEDTLITDIEARI